MGVDWGGAVAQQKNYETKTVFTRPASKTKEKQTKNKTHLPDTY